MNVLNSHLNFKPFSSVKTITRQSVCKETTLSFQISAEPSDINVLPEYNKDPRVVSNLVDGINRTRDDTHMWLAPFTLSKEHLIHLTLEQPVRVAMMRIWVSELWLLYFSNRTDLTNGIFLMGLPLLNNHFFSVHCE